MSDVALTIRRAEPADAEAMAHLMSHPEVLGSLMQLPYPSLRAWQDRLSQAPPVDSGELQLVALDGARVVGMAGLHPLHRRLRRRHAAMLGIAVLPSSQGQGVGRALMQAVCDFADRWAQVLRIELTVFVDNARAIALYRRFGFEIEGTLRAYALRDGAFVDAHCMARLHPSQPRLPA
jgi:putative acetyltransferase